ncbi:hypothetical protein [Leptospira meyeri]|uniref:hypothetical protein n=1 Tax=Leptospira meyeri TaxID=29508 RepID=UPI001083F6D1|nr:hypothetical protein [Leptospira meyeri]TGM61976.1 hypothetical protein EHQ93_11655 [Leptospira meyeri]
MHEVTLVPIETWAYYSPDLRSKKIIADIGIFAEALIYYETVYIIPGYPDCFTQLLTWFQKQNALGEFLSLLEDGSIKIYDYEFLSTAIEKDGEYSLWNIEGEDQKKSNVFEKRYLYNKEIEKILPQKARYRKKFYEAFRRNIIEVKSDAFGASIKNAEADYHDQEKNNHTIQALVDEIYSFKNLGTPPKINTSIMRITEDKIQIDWSSDMNELSKIAGTEIGLNIGTPLSAYAHSNRFLWSSAATGFDLYLSNPMGKIVGNKLYEASKRNSQLSKLIDSLQTEVDFPDIRNLVNNGILGIYDILKIRKKGKLFRNWLQQETERDRNAIIAYHNEVLKDSNLLKYGRKSLQIFGILAGGALGGALGSEIAGPIGGGIGGISGSAVSFLTDITSKIGNNWKPVIFGNWLKEQIK